MIYLSNFAVHHFREIKAGTSAASHVAASVKREERQMYPCLLTAPASFLYWHIVQGPAHEMALPTFRVGLHTSNNNHGSSSQTFPKGQKYSLETMPTQSNRTLILRVGCSCTRSKLLESLGLVFLSPCWRSGPPCQGKTVSSVEPENRAFTVLGQLKPKNGF